MVAVVACATARPLRLHCLQSGPIESVAGAGTSLERSIDSQPSRLSTEYPIAPSSPPCSFAPACAARWPRGLRPCGRWRRRCASPRRPSSRARSPAPCTPRRARRLATAPSRYVVCGSAAPAGGAPPPLFAQAPAARRGAAARHPSTTAHPWGTHMWAQLQRPSPPCAGEGEHTDNPAAQPRNSALPQGPGPPPLARRPQPSELSRQCLNPPSLLAMLSSSAPSSPGYAPTRSTSRRRRIRRTWSGSSTS